MANSRRKQTSIQKETLYCSFCGKSQHEIRKLIAGPTVFICDECVELCDDIIWNETGDRILIKVKVPPSSPFDDVIYDALSKIVAEKYPDYDFRYECRSFSASSLDPKSPNVVIFSIARPAEVSQNEEDDTQNTDETLEDYAKIKDDLAKAVAQISVLTTKFIHQSSRYKEINSELTELKLEYLEYVRNNSPKKKIQSDIRAVMFLDVSGFSKMEFDKKQQIIDMLRGITPTLLHDKGACDVNMWGDAIVANFIDPDQAIESSIRFIRHLGVEGMDVRIGMAWGPIRISFNSTTGRRDIDGDVVDYAARLEPLAPVGGVLLSKEFGAMDLSTEIAELIPVKVEVKKAFHQHEVGDTLNLYSLRIKKN
jgi:hypothetical protein